MTSLRTLGSVVIVGFACVMAGEAVSACADWQLVSFLAALQAGAHVDPADGDAIDALRLLAAQAVTVLTVGCGVFFLIWFYRAYKNLGGWFGVDPADQLSYTPAWAVGGFFVPILNLVRPYFVMRELWSASAFLAGQPETTSWRRVRPSGEITVWWMLFLAGRFGIALTGAHLQVAADLDSNVAGARCIFMARLVSLAGAGVALHLVSRVTDMQETARRRLAEPAEPATAAAHAHP